MTGILAALGDAALGTRGCAFTFPPHGPDRGVGGVAQPPVLPRTPPMSTGCWATSPVPGWAVVTMDEAVRRLDRPGAARFVNVSIDDVYRDTAETLLPVFRRHGVPVTLFVTTGIPDRTMPMWGAGLETILGRAGGGGRRWPPPRDGDIRAEARRLRRHRRGLGRGRRPRAIRGIQRRPWLRHRRPS